MRDEFIFYISAAADLDVLRDMLARAVVDIPVTLKWRIVQSPLRDEPLDYGAIQQVDLHVLALGGDIRAPIGLEWLIARQARRLPLLFLQEDAHRTQAASDFVRHVGLDAVWRPFTQFGAVRMAVWQEFGRILLNSPHRHNLSHNEIEALQTWLTKLDEQQSDSPDTTQTVASTNSVILSAERFEPSDGILLRKKG